MCNIKSAYETKICPVISWLHCKGHLKSQHNFFISSCYSALLDMQIGQGVTSHFIMTFEKINLFRNSQYESPTYNF